MLNGHPDRNIVPGVEANPGPLGHGLPIAVGAALAAHMMKILARPSFQMLLTEEQKLIDIARSR